MDQISESSLLCFYWSFSHVSYSVVIMWLGALRALSMNKFMILLDMAFIVEITYEGGSYLVREPILKYVAGDITFFIRDRH